MSHIFLDARNLLCPAPVIRVQHRIGSLTKGDLLEVWCTDPGTMLDIPSWCRIHGHQIVSKCETPDGIRIVIKVGFASP